MALTEYTRILKALSDPTRLRIIRILQMSQGELCICEFVRALGAAQYHISRHMGELRSAGLVKERRAGRFVLYSLIPPEAPFGRELLAALRSVRSPECMADVERLKKAPLVSCEDRGTLC